jgi:hypothetical protein
VAAGRHAFAGDVLFGFVPRESHEQIPNSIEPRLAFANTRGPILFERAAALAVDRVETARWFPRQRGTTGAGIDAVANPFTTSSHLAVLPPGKGSAVRAAGLDTVRGRPTP